MQISPPDANVHFYEKVKDLKPKAEKSNYANVCDEDYENFNKKAEKKKEESHYLVPDVFNPYIEPDVLPE